MVFGDISSFLSGFGVAVITLTILTFGVVITISGTGGTGNMANTTAEGSVEVELVGPFFNFTLFCIGTEEACDDGGFTLFTFSDENEVVVCTVESYGEPCNCGGTPEAICPDEMIVTQTEGDEVVCEDTLSSSAGPMVVCDDTIEVLPSP